MASPCSRPRWRQRLTLAGLTSQRLAAWRHDVPPAIAAVLRKHKPARHLLSGLIACGVCGGPVTLQGRDSYGCATRKEKQTCGNGRRIKRSELERRILDAVAGKLLHPDLVAEYIRAYRSERARQSEDARSSRTALEAKAAELERRVERLAEKIADSEAEGPAERVLMDQLRKKAAELEHTKEAIKALPGPEPATLHPNIGERLARQVADLRSALDQDAVEATAAPEALRSLLDRVVLTPALDTVADGRSAGLSVMLEGKLAALLDLSEGRPGTLYRGMLGAGTGFEPVTFRL
jgi:site-specific DNA recombinase